MKEGDVALSPLPQADGQIKNRPVVLLRRMPGFGDWLVCGISTQIHQQAAGFDETIEESHADYRRSGLKAASVVRLGFLDALPSNKFIGIIGSVPTERHQRLLRRLSDHLRP